MAKFYHIRETDNLDGDLSITISYTHLYTHTHKYTVCVTDSAPSYIYIYILISLFHHTELSICFTAQIDHHHVCMYIYIHMYTHIHTYILFHHTELTSVLPHRWPSFTTLGKPTVWMVTYLSPSYTPICTRVRTYTVCFTDIPPSYIYIYIHIYSVSPHRVKHLFYRTDSPPSCIYIYIYTPDGELIITTLYTHMYTHTHTNILFVLQTSHHQIYIYIHIYSVSPHRVKYLFYRTDSPPSCIYIYTYILCFTTQS